LRLATEPQSIRVDSRARRPLRSTAAKVAIALALTAALSAGALIAAGVAPAGAGSAAEADLQIANTNVIGASTDCADVAPYVDTQTVPPLTINNIEPGTAVTRYVCVHNRGEAPAAVDLAIVNAAEVETGCTGDEADFDPDGAGCGTRGELGADLAVTVGATDVGPAGSCQGTPAAEVVYHGVADTAGEAITPAVGAGEYGCYRIDVVYLAFTPADQVQANQTDRTTWQFRFVGSATAAPAVSLPKSLADQTVDRAVWKLRVHNAGPGPVAGPITVVDHLPVGLAFVSGTGAGFSCDAVDRTVACTRADPIDAGDSAVITLVTAIDPGLAGTVTNRAEVLAAGDVNVGDNTGTARLVAGNGPGGGNGGGGGTGGQGGGGSEPLAFTGIDAGRLVILAAGLLAFGLALVWVARRGRRDQ